MNGCSHEIGGLLFVSLQQCLRVQRVVCIQFFSDQNVSAGFGNYIPPFLFVPWFRQHAKFPYYILYLFTSYETSPSLHLHRCTNPSQRASQMTSFVVVPYSKLCILPRCIVVLQREAVPLPLWRVGMQIDPIP